MSLFLELGVWGQNWKNNAENSHLFAVIENVRMSQQTWILENNTEDVVFYFEAHHQHHPHPMPSSDLALA